jgi:tetratricopeptide (TPR) repeat protein
MWIETLRKLLLALAGLFLAGLAFMAGVYASQKTAPRPMPAADAQKGAQQVRVARERVEEALAARFAGDQRKALDLFASAAEADSSLQGLDYQRGLSLLELGETAAAAEAAQRSLSRGEEEANAYALLVLCEAARASTGRPAASPEEVLALADKGRTADPLNPAPYYALAEFFRAVGQPALALGNYQKALERVSKSDSIMVATVKAGLSGIRLQQGVGPDVVVPSLQDKVTPPEWLFFAAADALLKGDKATAQAFLERARGVLPPDLFKALLDDSFFQDYMPDGMVPNPQPSIPQ